MTLTIVDILEYTITVDTDPAVTSLNSSENVANGRTERGLWDETIANSCTKKGKSATARSNFRKMDSATENDTTKLKGIGTESTSTVTDKHDGNTCH